MFFSDQKLRDGLFIGIVKQTAKVLSFKLNLLNLRLSRFNKLTEKRSSCNNLLLTFVLICGLIII